MPAQLERALAAYRHRATMAGWDEETWQARYQAALLVERLKQSPAEIERAYLEAWNARPRAPSRWCSSRAGTASAASGRRRSCSRARRRRRRGPADQLFVEDAVYAWRALDELAIAAWHAGARDEGRAAAERLVAEARFPAERARADREESRLVRRRGSTDGGPRTRGYNGPRRPSPRRSSDP